MFKLCSSVNSLLGVSAGESVFSLLTLRSSLLTRFIHTTMVDHRRAGIISDKYSFHFAVKASIPNIDVYTHEPLPKIKTGGRGPDGRVVYKHLSGGLKRPYFMVDGHRGGKNNGDVEVIQEKILFIHKNWWRSEKIALVGNGLNKRWIYATTDMREGDIVRSYGKVSKLITQPIPGDAYPIGCLPIGTSVCQIERVPGEGSKIAIKAGTQGTIHQRIIAENVVIIKLSKKYFIKLSSGCAAVVGQMSNPDHNKMKFYKFGQKRWLGIKQRSGFYNKKSGRFGRKIKPVRPAINRTGTFAVHRTANLSYTKPELPDGCKKKGTLNNPACFKPIPLEKDEIHPKFRWCTWSIVR